MAKKKKRELFISESELTALLADTIDEFNDPRPGYAAADGSTLFAPRRGRTVYGIYWRGRLMKLGNTVFYSVRQARHVIENYVQRSTSPPDEPHWDAIEEIVDRLIATGQLSILALDTWPNPPDIVYPPRAAIDVVAS